LNESVSTFFLLIDNVKMDWMRYERSEFWMSYYFPHYYFILLKILSVHS
jgi:hypothetical protein